MRLEEFAFLLDANVPAAVSTFLISRGIDCQSATAHLPPGAEDADVMRWAYARGMVNLTQDDDFGTLAFRDGIPFVGLVFIRPGHVRPEVAVQTLQLLLEQQLDLHPPFIVVAERGRGGVSIRVRQPNTGP
jgi:predicted nuclease of predicted toxin-antitoxin system